MNTVESGAGRLSLGQRLAQGRLRAPEALRYAALLAESLRKAHEEGRVYGFLTPSAVWLNGPSLELVPPVSAPRVFTPYTAPELLLGKPPDSRSDIFSFGAILYEMLTGWRAFAGDTQADLAYSLQTAQPGSTGSAAADRLLGGCLAKDPDGRWPQMQKVILELKLLDAPRQAEGSPHPEAHDAPGPLRDPALPGFPPAGEAAAPPFPSLPQFTPPVPAEPASPLQGSPAQPLLSPAPDLSAVRGEIQQSETRLVTRMQLSEKALAVLNRAVADALTALRTQVASLTGQLAAFEDRANLGLVGGGDASAPETLARIEQTLQAFGTRMEVIEKGIAVLQDRVGRNEQDAQSARQQVKVLHTSVAEDFVAFEQSLQKQERAVDSARTAMAQTDDLVERLVEALEALQATVLQRSEQFTADVN